MDIEKEFERARKENKRISKILMSLYEHIDETPVKERIKDTAKQEIGQVRDVQRLLAKASSCYEDERYYDSYRYMMKVAELKKQTPEALEEINRRKKNDIVKELADYIQEEIWDNQGRLESFKTKLMEEKACKKAEAILEGKNVSEIPPNLKNTSLDREKILENAKKKGYLEKYKHYQPWTFQTDKIEIFEKEETQIYQDLAVKLKKKARSYGRKEIGKRPQILLPNPLLEEVNNRVRRNTMGKESTEIMGRFLFEKINADSLLLTDYSDVQSEDKRDATDFANDQFPERLKHEGVKERIILFHSHPQKYSGYGKEDMLSPELREGGDAGVLKDHREGIGIVATPWKGRKEPEEDVVWFAGIIKKEQGHSRAIRAGKIPIHIVNQNNEIIDQSYSWPKIYNDRIELSITSKLGPYWLHMEEITDQWIDPQRNYD